MHNWTITRRATSAFWRSTLLGALLALTGPAAAATATWTNTVNGVTEYWINTANWNASSYPGSGANENAYLNTAAPGVYTAILDTALPPKSINVLTVMNAAGQAVLRIANATLTNATLNIGSGGRVQLDAGGKLRNTSALNVTGGNANLRLNSGGTLVTMYDLTLFNGGSGRSLLADSADAAAPGVWNLSSKRLNLFAAGATGNGMTINGVVATNVSSGVYLGNGAATVGNILVVTNGGRIFSPAYSIIGNNGGSSNAMYVVGSNSLWTLSTSTLAIGAGTAGGVGGNLLWADGSTITVGNLSMGAKYNMLVMTNGAQFRTSNANSSIGGGSLTGNTVRVFGGTAGQKSVMNYGNYTLSIGSGAGGVANALLVGANGVVTNVQLTVGSGAGSTSNTLAISAGGQTHFNGGLTIGASGAPGNQLIVSGSGALLRNMGQGQQYIGNASAGNLFRIENGAVATSLYNLYVGNAAGGNGNSLVISNGGVLATIEASYIGAASSYNTALITGTNSQWQTNGKTLSVGNGSSSNNVLRIENGGLLEANAIKVNDNGSAGPNTVTNAGGIYQFTTASPTITLANGGMVYLNGGAISFRAIDNADVTCNRKGGKLDATSLMTFAGKNAFRLNNASNATSGQAYTFTDALGPTNFCRLELLNNATYRGGAVTIGANGSLYLAGGASTIADALTFNASSTLELDIGAVTDASALVAQGDVALNDCALKLNLRTAPRIDDAATIVNKQSAGRVAGQFGGGRIVTATLNGTNYFFRLAYDAGDGNDIAISCVRDVRGTLIMIF
jgi:T5SS/PEP-CTERM-associated repeat protein